MVPKITHPPFIHNGQNSRQIMIDVMWASLPGLLTLTYFFGVGVLIQLVIATTTALFFEGIALKLRCQSLKSNLSDGSALITALLVALSVPPLSKWWMVVLATAFAIIIAKQIYGGLGYNPFNPAMIGYIVLLISFPAQMTNWSLQQNLLLHQIPLHNTIGLIFSNATQNGIITSQLHTTIDGITQATPLDQLKHKSYVNMQNEFFYSLNWKKNAGWICSNISFLMGGLYLIYRKVISWHIPFSILSVMLVLFSLSYFLTSETKSQPLLHLFSGATMLGAFFIATDPVTTTTTIKGKLIFGSLTGFLIWLIRIWGVYPDGVAFSVLLANICAPLIDYCILSRGNYP